MNTRRFHRGAVTLEPKTKLESLLNSRRNTHSFLMFEKNTLIVKKYLIEALHCEPNLNISVKSQILLYTYVLPLSFSKAITLYDLCHSLNSASIQTQQYNKIYLKQSIILYCMQMENKNCLQFNWMWNFMLLYLLI